MFLSNPAKSFLPILFIFISAAGCGVLRTDENTAAKSVEEPKSRYPFKSQEPENFQCEIVETAGPNVRRKRVAKKGNWRRTDFDIGDRGQRALLQTDREFHIDFSRGVYAERTAGGGGGQFSELTHDLLTTAPRADFAEAGREGNIIRFTARPSDSDASEIVVHYDVQIGIPVKQEFFSLDEGSRSLRLTIEIVDFKTEPDPDVFSIPPGFRRISMSEMAALTGK